MSIAWWRRFSAPTAAKCLDLRDRPSPIRGHREVVGEQECGACSDSAMSRTRSPCRAPGNGRPVSTREARTGQAKRWWVPRRPHSHSGRNAGRHESSKVRARGDNDQALTLGEVAASARRQPDQRGDQDRDEKHHHDDGGRDRAVPVILLVHVSPSCG